MLKKGNTKYLPSIWKTISASIVIKQVKTFYLSYNLSLLDWQMFCLCMHKHSICNNIACNIIKYVLYVIL